MYGASREKPVAMILKPLDKVLPEKLLKRKVSPEDFMNFCWRNKESGKKKKGIALAGKL